MDFDTALATFTANLQAMTNDFFARNYPNLKPPTISTERGAKYVRVVKADEVQRSVHSFIRIEDGAILKAAGWKAPYIGKTEASTVRGNIYKGMDGVSIYGAEYRR